MSAGREVWLKGNPRPMMIALITAAIFEGFGYAAVALAISYNWGTMAIAAGGIVAALATLLMIGAVIMLTIPRLARDGNELLVYLGSLTPERVPLSSVECFFLGQGPSMLPDLGGRESETTNVIVRLAESALDLKHRDVDAKYAHWCEGYITLRGAWCETITKDGMAALNRKLIEAQREMKNSQVPA